MRKADNLPPYCAVVKKSRSLNFLDPFGSAWPVTGVLYLCYYPVRDDPKELRFHTVVLSVRLHAKSKRGFGIILKVI